MPQALLTDFLSPQRESCLEQFQTEAVIGEETDFKFWKWAEESRPKRKVAEKLVL